MISKVEAIQKLKKMGVIVADDHSIVTVLIPAGISFEKGIKDIRAKLKEIDYDASFCIKQTKDEAVRNDENVSEEEADTAELFSMEDDGQFTLGNFGMEF